MPKKGEFITSFAPEALGHEATPDVGAVLGCIWLKTVMLPIDALTPYSKNARKHKRRDIEGIKQSIRLHGFRDPIGVWGEHNIIVEGHGRWIAAKELGFTEVLCIRLDDMTDEQRRAYALAHNRTAELSEWDFDILAGELADLDAFDVDLGAFEFDAVFGVDMDSDSDGGDKTETGWTKPTNEFDGSEITLKDRFVVPPVSTLDTRQGYWQDRVRMWRAKIGDFGEARTEAKMLRPDFVAKYGGRTISLLDPVLAEISARWFMPGQGDKCFDVFAGDTVFGYVAASLGKEFTGIELRQEQADFNNQQTADLPARYICDDGRNVLEHIQPGSQDLLFSCPPYFDLEVYSDQANDASNQETYEDFYAILDAAFTGAIQCLKDNRFAVIVVGDVRSKKDGSYYDFPGDIKRTFKRNGMALYNELVLINNIGTGAVRASRNMRARKVVKCHQNVLVFYKGDTGKIKDHFPELNFPAEEVFADESDNEQLA